MYILRYGVKVRNVLPSPDSSVQHFIHWSKLAQKFWLNCKMVAMLENKSFNSSSEMASLRIGMAISTNAARDVQ